MRFKQRYCFHLVAIGQRLGSNLRRFKKLNSKGFSMPEMLVAMMILVMVLGTVPTLMKQMTIISRNTIDSIHESRKESSAISGLLKDVKTSANCTITEGGKRIFLQRTLAGEGVSYYFADNKLYRNEVPILDDVNSATFGQDNTVVSATIEIVDSEPIQLVMRRPNLKTLVDDGHAPVQPEFNRDTLDIWFNGYKYPRNSTGVTMVIPVVEIFSVNIKCDDPMSNIIYYTVDQGRGPSERKYIMGSEITFDIETRLSDTVITIKTQSENGAVTGLQTFKLKPACEDDDLIPDWMWGPDEAFRLYMLRSFSSLGIASLEDLTFGDVRSRDTYLKLYDWHISAMGDIATEFKKVSAIYLHDTWIDRLPRNFGENMPNLQVLDLENCTRLLTNPADDSFATFKNNYNNPSWRNANCRNLTVIWPELP